MKYSIESLLEDRAKHFESMLISDINSGNADSCSKALENYKEYKEVYILFKKKKYSTFCGESQDVYKRVRHLLKPLRQDINFFLKHKAHRFDSMHYDLSETKARGILSCLKTL